MTSVVLRLSAKDEICGHQGSFEFWCRHWLHLSRHKRREVKLRFRFAYFSMGAGPRAAVFKDCLILLESPLSYSALRSTLGLIGSQWAEGPVVWRARWAVGDSSMVRAMFRGAKVARAGVFAVQENGVRLGGLHRFFSDDYVFCGNPMEGDDS